MIFSLAFLATLAVYLSTLYPHIAPEDSGEFVTSAWTLGIPHASGYSIYTLLGKIVVQIIPFGNPAYRVNTLSALLGATTCLLLAGAITRLPPERTHGLTVAEELERERWRSAGLWTSALLWALVPTVWYLSILAEVYAAHLFFGALLIWSASRWSDMETFFSRTVFRQRMILSAFLAGAAAGLHQTAVLWMPGLLAFLAARRPHVDFPRPLSAGHQEKDRPGFWPLDGKHILVAGILLALVGFSIQFFLWQRAMALPVLNTGEPDGWERFLRVVLRQDYGTLSLAKNTPAGARSEILLLYLAALFQAFTPLGIPFIVWGLWIMARRQPGMFGGFFLLWFIPGPVFLLASRPSTQEHFRGVVERFYPFSFLALTIFLAWGIYDAGLKWPRARKILFLLLPLGLTLNIGVSGRGNLHARDFGLNLLRSLPPRAVLWNPGDTAAYSVMQRQLVSGHRKDVALGIYYETRWGRETLLRAHPDLVPAFSIGSNSDRTPLLSRILSGSRGDRLFTEVPTSLPGIDPSDGLAARRRYPNDALPLGLAYRYFPSDKHKLVDPLAQLSLTRLTFSRYHRSAPWRTGEFFFSPKGFSPKDIFTTEILRRYAEAHTNMGLKLAKEGLSEQAEEEYRLALAIDPRQMEANNNLGVLAFDQGNMSRATVFFRRSAALRPGDASLHFNLGLALRKTGDNMPALEAFRKSAGLNPSHVATQINLAEILSFEGLHEESLTHWREARKLNPEDKNCYWQMALGYDTLGQSDKALATLREYTLLSLTKTEKTQSEEFRLRLERKKK